MKKTRRLMVDLVHKAWREVAGAGPLEGFIHLTEADYDQHYDQHLEAFIPDRPNGPVHVFACGSLMCLEYAKCPSGTAGLNGQELAQRVFADRSCRREDKSSRKGPAPAPVVLALAGYFAPLPRRIRGRFQAKLLPSI